MTAVEQDLTIKERSEGTVEADGITLEEGIVYQATAGCELSIEQQQVGGSKFPTGDYRRPSTECRWKAGETRFIFAVDGYLRLNAVRADAQKGDAILRLVPVSKIEDF